MSKYEIKAKIVKAGASKVFQSWNHLIMPAFPLATGYKLTGTNPFGNLAGRVLF